jgi:hypothetical protein
MLTFGLRKRGKGGCHFTEFVVLGRVFEWIGKMGEDMEEEEGRRMRMMKGEGREEGGMG